MSDAASEIESLLRPAIRALAPYVSARSLTTRGSIFLDANESSESVVGKLNRYPEPQPASLLARFAEIYGVPTNSICVGRGSDEAIDLLVRVFAEANIDRILVCPPTYGMYEVAAATQGCGIRKVALGADGSDFALDDNEIVARAEKLIFLCSPNNPTGTAFDPEVMESICARVRGRSIVVVDEAYAEFSDRKSMLSALARNPNLVILRTMSKARALAGVRCGVAIASPEIIKYLQRVRAPYPLSTPQVDLVHQELSPEKEATVRTRVSATCKRRDALSRALQELPSVLQIFSSSANFLLVRFSDAGRIDLLQRATARGLILRDRSSEPGLRGCVRITIGSEAENAQLLEVAQEAARSAR